MAKQTIKFQKFWYMAEMPAPGDTTVLAEQIASYGEEVDITDDYDLQRGEEQGAFMTDDEIEAFKAEVSPYDLISAEEQSAAAAEQLAAAQTDGFDWANASAEDMADHMEENNMTVNEVLEVAHNNPDRLDDLLEAENIVTGDSPRKGVTEGIEKIASDKTE